MIMSFGRDEITDSYQEFLPSVVHFANDAAHDAAMPLIRAAWEQSRAELRHRCPGQFAAIIPGRVLDVFPSWEQAEKAVLRIDPVPDCYAVIEVDDDSILYPVSESEKRTA